MTENTELFNNDPTSQTGTGGQRTPRKRPPNRRPYHRHGEHVVKKALPYLQDRVCDPDIPEETLSPIEQAARKWRLVVLRERGGSDKVAETLRTLVNTTLGTKIIMDSMDRYIMELAQDGGLVNRRSRRAFQIVADRNRVAETLTKQLSVIGFELREADLTPTLDQIRQQFTRQTNGGESHETD
jgi:hypothetical protein